MTQDADVQGLQSKAESTSRISEKRKVSNANCCCVDFARTGQDNQTAYDRHVGRDAQNVSGLRSRKVWPGKK